MLVLAGKTVALHAEGKMRCILGAALETLGAEVVDLAAHLKPDLVVWDADSTTPQLCGGLPVIVVGPFSWRHGCSWSEQMFCTTLTFMRALQFHEITARLCEKVYELLGHPWFFVNEQARQYTTVWPFRLQDNTPRYVGLMAPQGWSRVPTKPEQDAVTGRIDYRLASSANAGFTLGATGGKQQTAVIS